MDVIPIGIQNQNSQSRIGRIDPYKRNAPQRNACRIPRPRQGSHPLAGGRAKRTPPETIPHVFPTPNGVASTPAPNTPYTSSTQRETVPRPRTGVAPISRRSSEANTSGNDPPRISDPERGRVHSQPQTHPTPTGHNANFTQISQNPTNQTPKSGNLVNFRKISRKKVNPILA